MFPHNTCMLWNLKKQPSLMSERDPNDIVEGIGESTGGNNSVSTMNGWELKYPENSNSLIISLGSQSTSSLPSAWRVPSNRHEHNMQQPEVPITDPPDPTVFGRIIPDTTVQTTTTMTTVSVSPPIPSKAYLARRLSDTDRPLLEALLQNEAAKARTATTQQQNKRHACTGRFLTMHKRRRKKLNTRGFATVPAILDDILHGHVRHMLDRVGNWKFNAFILENVTGGRSLPVLCVHLFHLYGLLDHFNLDVVRVWKLFTLIEEGYHSSNPYHNSIHATDVTQAMHCFLQESKILKYLEPLEIMASLIGAVTHDLDHPGVNQQFLITTSNHLAALYKNASVLENHHWRSAVGCLLESGLAEQLTDVKPELESQIQSLILATDITRQQEFLTRFKRYLNPGPNEESLDMRVAEHRHFILQIALKCADISNPCRPWDISKKWSHKVCEEFYRQGDYERQLGLMVTSLCDRQTTSVPKIQEGFIRVVVTPLMNEWHRFLQTDVSYKMMHHLKFNQCQWERKLHDELAEETRTEISDAEMLDDIDEPGFEHTPNETSSSSENLLPLPLDIRRRGSLQVPTMRPPYTQRDRRMSVPLHVPKIVLPPKQSSPPDAIQEITEEHEHIKFDQDSLSILSSDSDSGPRRSSAGSTEKERPLSAENLLPESSIASISDSAHTDAITMVLHGASNTNSNMLGVTAPKHLIRQQTFPPIQAPYNRQRYMSSTAELGTCPEALRESRSSNSSGSTDNSENQMEQQIRKKDSWKRKPEDYGDRGNKVMSIIPGQKENMDPSMWKHNLSRRRGSAPVTVALPTKQPEIEIGMTIPDKIRRGSVPAEFISINFFGQSQTTFATTNVASQPQPSASVPLGISVQRRLSVPTDMLLQAPGQSRTSSKRRNAKKALKRQSSDVAEILSPIWSESIGGDSTSESSGSTAWRASGNNRPSDLESLLTKRRGSLPADPSSNIAYSSTLRH